VEPVLSVSPKKRDAPPSSLVIEVYTCVPWQSDLATLGGLSAGLDGLDGLDSWLGWPALCCIIYNMRACHLDPHT